MAYWLGVFMENKCDVELVELMLESRNMRKLFLA
jgi:hypothetical protein